MTPKTNVVALKPSSHSCFYYETDNLVVSVYSRNKKKLRLHEINAALDIAKADLVERMRQ
jgi:hypothetical protein